MFRFNLFTVNVGKLLYNPRITKCMFSKVIEEEQPIRNDVKKDRKHTVKYRYGLHKPKLSFNRSYKPFNNNYIKYNKEGDEEHTIFIKKLVKDGKLQEAENALDGFLKKKYKNSSPFTMVLKALGDALPPAKFAIHAEKHLQKMRENDVEVNDFIYHVIINAFSKRGKLEEAFSYLNQMIELGLTPSHFAISPIILYLSKNPNKEYLDKVLKITEQHKITLKVIETTQLLEAASRTSQFSLVERIWENMKKDNIKPNIFTISTLIEAAGEGKRSDKISQFWQSLEENSLKPNIESFTAKMRAFLKCEQLDKGVQVFVELEHAHMRPTIKMLTTFLRLFRKYFYKNPSSSRAQDYLDEFKEKILIPDDEIDDLLNFIYSIKEVQSGLNKRFY